MSIERLNAVKNMKRDDAFELAIQWRDNPQLLVGDLRATCDWLIKNSLVSDSAPLRTDGARILPSAMVPEAIERLMPLHKALEKYTLLLKLTKLDADLLVPLLESLTNETADSAVSAPVATGVMLCGLTPLIESIELTQQWVSKQQQRMRAEGNRSEILKTTIELIGDELLVNTDRDGSLKLRGSTNIPMFLAFFRNSRHHLSIDAFLDIDRTVKATNLDRHRVRLSSKLHDVYIEIIEEKGGYRMRNFR